MPNFCNEKIRVANIIEEARLGGPQLRMIAVASFFNHDIHSTLIFPKKNSFKFQKKCQNKGISYLLTPLTTPRKNLLTILKFIFFFPFEIIRLYLILKKNNFDVVHLSGGSWQYKGIIAAKLANIKVVWELNDTYVPFLVRIAFLFFSRFSNGFIFASQRTQNYYKKLVPKNKPTFVIQSPVDTNFFDPNLDYKNTNINKIENLSDKIVMGTTSNINPVKGLDVLIKASKQLKNLQNKIVFLVIGTVYENQKKYYNYLLELIRTNNIKNFYFLGEKDNVREFLHKIDVYICCSNYESSPLAVWEAMSMSKPIISTDVGDVEKFVTNNVNGMIVPTGTENGLADAIRKLATSPRLRNSFGKLSREVAIKEFNINKCVNLHKKVYKLILNPKIK